METIVLTDYQRQQEALQIASWAMPSPMVQYPELAKKLKGPLASAAFAGTLDKGVGNVFGGDSSLLPDMGPLADFESWESVAATICHRAEKTSGFNPGDTKFDQNAWNEYLRKFSTIPFFLSFTSDSRSASISSLSLEKSVSAVDDLIKSFVTADVFTAVVTSIKKIAQLAIENEGQTQKNNSQQQGVLSRKGSQLYLGTIRTEVTMEYKSGKGYEQLSQSLSIHRAYGVLDFSKCKRNSDLIREWDGRDAEEWGANTASYSKRPNGSPAWGP